MTGPPLSDRRNHTGLLDDTPFRPWQIAHLSGVPASSSRSRKRSNASRLTGFELSKALHPDRRGTQGVRIQLAPFHPARAFPAGSGPPGSGIVRCFEIAASDISKGSATSVTAMSSSNSIVRMARRVGSAKAEKTWSKGSLMPLAYAPAKPLERFQRYGCRTDWEGHLMFRRSASAGLRPMSRAMWALGKAVDLGLDRGKCGRLCCQKLTIKDQRRQGAFICRSICCFLKLWVTACNLRLAQRRIKHQDLTPNV